MNFLEMNFRVMNFPKMNFFKLRKPFLAVFLIGISMSVFSQEQLGSRLRYDFGGTIYGSVHQFSITDVYDGKVVTFFIKKEMNDVFSIDYVDLHYRNLLAYPKKILIGTAELHSTGFIRIIDDHINTLAETHIINLDWENYTAEIARKISDYFNVFYPNPVQIAAIYSGTIKKDDFHILQVMLVIDSIDASNNILNSYFMYFENNCFGSPIRLSGTLTDNTLKLENRDKIHAAQVSMVFENFNVSDRKIDGIWKDSADNKEYKFELTK